MISQGAPNKRLERTRHNGSSIGSNLGEPVKRSVSLLPLRLEMSEAYRKEFEELSAFAEKYLQQPKVHLPHHVMQLRLWRYPSFDRWVSLVVYEPASRYTLTDSSVVTQVTRDRPLDAERFMNPMKGLAHGLSRTPTISLRQADVPSEEFNLRLVSLKAIAAPLMIDSSTVLDGEEFGLETFGM